MPWSILIPKCEWGFAYKLFIILCLLCLKEKGDSGKDMRASSSWKSAVPYGLLGIPMLWAFCFNCPCSSARDVHKFCVANSSREIRNLCLYLLVLYKVMLDWMWSTCSMKALFLQVRSRPYVGLWTIYIWLLVNASWHVPSISNMNLQMWSLSVA